MKDVYGEAVSRQFSLSAFKLFIEKGYRAVELQDISDECGLNLSSVSHCFPRKESFVIELMDTIQLFIGDFVDHHYGDSDKVMRVAIGSDLFFYLLLCSEQATRLTCEVLDYRSLSSKLVVMASNSTVVSLKLTDAKMAVAFVDAFNIAGWGTFELLYRDLSLGKSVDANTIARVHISTVLLTAFHFNIDQVTKVLSALPTTMADKKEALQSFREYIALL